jgi:ParB family chromosome partitioning protein
MSRTVEHLAIGVASLEIHSRCTGVDARTDPEVAVEEILHLVERVEFAENLARRQHSPVELVQEIRSLSDRGYTYAQIARKTDLSKSYVQGILQLLKKGEERLVQAVETGKIPLSIAMTISRSDDKEIQKALAEAYESNDLRGKQLLTARRLIEKRRIKGKSARSRKSRSKSSVSTNDLLRVYQEETFRQRMVIQKSKICETRLLFAVSALKQLLEDDNFVDVLHAESLATLPHYLAVHIKNGRDE